MKTLLLLTSILLFIFVAGFFALGNFSYNETLELPDAVPGHTETDAEMSADEKSAPPSLLLVPRTVSFEDGTAATLRIPEGFEIAVAAEGLGKARFMATSPDGRLFVPDMVNMNLSHEGKIYVLEDFDEDTERFRKKSVYLADLRGPNSVAFYTDEQRRDWIYIALTANLVRYRYRSGDVNPPGEPEVVMEFPNKQVPGETSVVWHITRTITFYNDRLYVSVGSGCNACEQPEGEMRAMIYSVDPRGGDARIYADGLRNAVGFAWAGGALYATVNGVDHLGDDAPDDLMYRIVQGESYGWPYCYESNGDIYPDTSREWTQSFSCAKVSRSFVSFGSHAAPLGVTYFSSDAHPSLKEAFLVALHGSFEPRIGAGYHVVRVAQDGTQEVFLDGFLAERRSQAQRFFPIAEAHIADEPVGDAERIGRPVHVLQRDANSFFVTDDYNGRLYYIFAAA